jgi:hypothetical protein
LRLTAGRGSAARDYHIALAWLGPALVALVMLQSVWDVYRINQPVAFTTSQQRNLTAREAIAWLKLEDPGLYYVSAGDWRAFWSWSPAAYELEQPLINLVYNRYLNSWTAQRSAEALVQATPKYQFAWTDVPAPEGGVLLREFDGVPLYKLPDALPFAFGVAPERLEDVVPLASREVQAFAARWANPNRLEVTASAGAPGQQLVALVSVFPGWRVMADGQPLALAPVNDYLGVQMLSGTHTYTFVYEPPAFYVGLAISAAALALAFAWIFEAPARRAWAAARRVRARRRLPPAVAAPPGA